VGPRDVAWNCSSRDDSKLIVDMPAYCTDVKFAWKTDSVAEMRDTEVCKETKEIGERNNEDRE
jgi:hypothetical protein